MEGSGTARRGPFYVLTDMVTADPGVDGERFQAMLEEAMDQGLVLDAAIAQSEADTASFWALRDATPEIMSHLSPMLAFDVSIPIGRIGEAVERMRGELEARWPGQDGLYFGHIGDSNLHLIYSLADDRESTALEAETLVYRVVSEYRGRSPPSTGSAPSNARSCHCRAAPVRSR